MDDSEAVQVRFRHTAGDLGPFQFPETASVQSLKDRVFAEWPKGMQLFTWVHQHIWKATVWCSTQPHDADGLWSKEPPQQAGDVRLILSGKFLDSSKVLKGMPLSPGPRPLSDGHRLKNTHTPDDADYKKDMGEVKADTIVTMLVHVRPQPAPSKQPGGLKGHKLG